MSGANIYPLKAVRALALHAQGLDHPTNNDPEASLDLIYNTVERLGCVQIDTLQMVRRSQYLILWSRLGRYNPTDLDRLQFDPKERRLFEGWQHAASIIPLEEYRFQMPYQRRVREKPNEWFQNWIKQPGHDQLMPTVMERIRLEGAVKVADFEYDGPKRSSWWDWKPVKTALEFLYAYGDLMIADRKNFQRVYDLTDRILPPWVDRGEPTTDERNRYWIERAGNALGICTPAQLAEYAYMKREVARPYVEQSIQDGIFIRVRANLYGDETQDLLVHRSKISLLEQAADGALSALRTTFLSPFDSLFWAKNRDQQFWGFRNLLEAYKPAPKRLWGYFCLPILHKDQLIGRFDPKLERKNGRLRIKSLYLEQGVNPDEELTASVATAMHDFLSFHDATELIIEQSSPPIFGEKLLAAL
jgi:uncharacterized protein YcaQ